ncbi:PEP-CTERM sorting domain-containing protein [Glaciecola sp. XM2]|uniref:lectin-like protein n=1 Tax=Glaciecola sp. XM2 TaxID=1914931 RepID=UPI001BDE5073|nr:lectin-like protein [Glaciecola sp. XM2]MBT1450156.1 PEP-CTERM sorting domain-containing protein [Glaciecola sp. XM2]
MFKICKKLVVCLGLISLGVSNAVASPIFTWTTESGGNGNSYQLVSAPRITWHDAKLAAEQAGGHLATITSQAESDFVFNLGVGDAQYWLGAFQPAGSMEPIGGWQWITGEEWSFTNWASGEPNNGSGGTEDALAYAFFRGDGSWNDAPSTYRNYTNGGYVIEYVPAPATIFLLALGVIGASFTRRYF